MREVLWGGWPSRPGPALLLIALLLLVGGTPTGVLAQKPDSGRAARHMLTLADLPEIKVFEEVAVSPDGRWVAYTMSRPYPGGGESKGGEITILDLRRGASSILRLAGSPRALAWSPVGATLAFIAPSEAHPRIWMYSPAGP
ncbi:MAG TPA: hypothetical protein VFY42_10980, partial [Gemmatimonadales bacterium]|nr:hypothetical protein [Gemmatimonadales bacterium]